MENIGNALTELSLFETLILDKMGVSMQKLLTTQLF